MASVRGIGGAVMPPAGLELQRSSRTYAQEYISLEIIQLRVAQSCEIRSDTCLCFEPADIFDYKKRFWAQ